jgi:hypothetical protein
VRDWLSVRRLLGLCVLTNDERRLLMEACLWVGGSFLDLPAPKFVSQVLEEYRKSPHSAGKRIQLRKLQKKVVEVNNA